MKLSSSNSLVLALLGVALLVAAFWLVLLSPKRDEAKKLDAQAQRVQASLVQHEGEVADAQQARQDFPANYRQLVVLGKAVPGDDDTASLLVQLNGISERADVRFSEFALAGSGDGGDGEAAPPPEAGGTTVSATEVAAATLPLGAEIGPAGLAVMPYSLTFEGGFFKLADFIEGLDSLVKTSSEKVNVDGRLITVDGFALSVDPEKGFPALQGNFGITTFLTPPTEGVTGGATPESPPPATATPASTTTGATR